VSTLLMFLFDQGVHSADIPIQAKVSTLLIPYTGQSVHLADISAQATMTTLLMFLCRPSYPFC
jgi:hypothetical protein